MSARQIIPQTHDPCALCHKPAATKRCGRCRAVVYCSRDCQARHWKSAHKLTCGAASPPVPPRPQTPGELAEDCARQLAERGYAALRSFREREGHADVPSRHVEGEVKLGIWLNNQRTRMQARGWSEAERKAKKVSALSDEDVSRLEALGARLL